MRLIYRTLILLAVLLVGTTLVLPSRYGMAYPNPPGPKFDKKVQQRYRTYIEENRSDLVLLGDSTLELGVDPDQLQQLTGVRTYKIGIMASASAEWYLIVKNNISRSDYMPKTLVIFFRDTLLTAPAYRVNGKYFERVDELAAPDEEVLLQKSYLNEMNPLEIWADQYLPLYSARLRIREGIDNHLRYGPTGLVGCDPDCTEAATYAVFQANDLDNVLLVDAVATAESYLYTSGQLDFARQIDRSYLPDILQLARKHGMRLVLVRMRTMFRPTEASETPALRKYITDLKTYADENDIVLIDFAHDERLTPDLFSDPLHLNDQGRTVFTGYLADALEAVLP